MIFNDVELRDRVAKLENYVNGLQSAGNAAMLNGEYKYQRCKGCRVVIAVYATQPDSLFHYFGDEVAKYWCPTCEPLERKRRLARAIAEKNPDCVIGKCEKRAKVKGGKK